MHSNACPCIMNFAKDSVKSAPTEPNTGNVWENS